MAPICEMVEIDGPMVSDNSGVKWNETKMQPMYENVLNAIEEREREKEDDDDENEATETVLAASHGHGHQLARFLCTLALSSFSFSSSLPLPALDNETWAQVFEKFTWEHSLKGGSGWTLERVKDTLLHKGRNTVIVGIPCPTKAVAVGTQRHLLKFR